MAVSKEGDAERMGKIVKKAQNATNKYDADLQMFVHKPAQLDMGRLRFLRWLAERGRLEHPVFGESVPVNILDTTEVSRAA